MRKSQIFSSLLTVCKFAESLYTQSYQPPPKTCYIYLKIVVILSFLYSILYYTILIYDWFSITWDMQHKFSGAETYFSYTISSTIYI